MVDEDVVKPIETPRLDGQRGCPHALLDEGDALLAEGVQKRATSTEHTRDGAAVLR